jgi:hypothetical protein
MLETVHDEVNRIIYGDSESVWSKTFAVFGSDNANPVALADEKYLILNQSCEDFFIRHASRPCESCL